MNKAMLYTILGGMMASASICSAANTVLPNKITSNTTLTTGTDYQINGYTYVMSGVTLTIEPGVHVYAGEGTGTNASALIVTRGAKIDAKGSASRPIVFEPVSAQTSELGPDDTGMWGGLIVLGKGVLNSNKAGSWTGACTQDVEGMIPATGDETLINFGGSDNADNSGTLSYVSIRHGGVVLSEGNEINGLTLGGVGSGTKIDHIEVFANKDDAIEIFGGAVNLSNVITAFAYDDSLDIDEGYQGQVQYLFAIQRAIVDNAGTITDQGDKGGEWDGADYPNDGTPEMLLKLANATFIGLGSSTSDSNPSVGTPAAISNTAINLRANGAAEVYNSVFAGYAKMLQIDATYKNQSGETVSDTAQIARFNEGDIKFGGNVWFSSTEANNTAAGLQVSGSTKLTNNDFFTSNNNQIAAPGITISRIAGSKALDVTPASGSASVTGTKATLPSGFEATTYAGAFKSDYNWAIGWTKLFEDGYFVNEGTWFDDPNLGWVWYPDGKLASGCKAYIFDLDSWAWIATDDATGSWMYLYK